MPSLELHTTSQRAVLLLLWCTVIAILSFYIKSQLTISGDLRLFLPAAQTRAQALLLDEIGASPAARLLAVSLQGAPPAVLATTSQALKEKLSGHPSIGIVSNGMQSMAALPDSMLTYRYLLTSSFDTTPLKDASVLRNALQDRYADLASAAASAIEPWLARDPTLELLQLAESWQPANQPLLQYEVWFNRHGNSALLLVETRAAPFDPDQQTAGLKALHDAFDAVKPVAAMEMTVSGPAAFSVLMQQRTQKEAQWLSGLATAGLIVLLWCVYRRFSYLLLAILPLASAGIVGLFTVSFFFGTIHGITLAFGFTLLGVAQDYPVHLFSHQKPGESSVITARKLWPTLATGVISTCIAYMAFLASGVSGLQQLACFTIVGLLTAGLITRYLLPRLLPTTKAAATNTPLLSLGQYYKRLPRARFTLLALIVVALMALMLSPGRFWQSDLSRLMPVPAELLQRDTALRTELGAPHVRYLLAVPANTAQMALEQLETLRPQLNKLVTQDAIGGYRHAADFLPSARLQRLRQSRLPSDSELITALQQAVSNTPFTTGLFTPFLREVATARDLSPLLPDDLAATPFATAVDSLLLKKANDWIALVTLTEVQDFSAVQKLLQARAPQVLALDLKQASEDLLSQHRNKVLWSLLVAAVLLILTVFASLRAVSRTVRVIAPMLLTTVLVISVLRLMGVELNLFHLIALVLAAGLGVDYALFFEAARDHTTQLRNTFHALLVCAASTLLVFALLATSTLPVLQAIGITVSLGVISNFILALWINRPHVDAR
jgi:predicted exporter